MGFESLEKFLQQKKDETTKNGVDWIKAKNEWLLKIDELYSIIQDLLRPLKERDLLHFRMEYVTITEEHIGTYKTKSLQIVFPDQKVLITPIGRNIIGAAGRVDLIGRNGKIKMLLVDEQSDGPKITVSIKSLTGNLVTPEKKKDIPDKLVWKIATPPPNIKFVDLNEDSFSDALFEVIGEYE